MSQEGTAEGSSTEDPVFSPKYSWGLFQEDVEEANSMSGLASDLPGASSGTQIGAGRRKRVLREGAQAGDAPGVIPETQAHLVVLELQAVGQSPDSVPGPKLHIGLPTVPALGRAQASKRLHISLYNILNESGPGNLCGMSVGLPEKAFVGRERPAGVKKVREGTSSLGCDGRSPTLSKEEPPRRDLPSSRGPVPVRARKKKRKCEVCSEGGEGAGGFLWLGQSSDRATPQHVGGPPQGADWESLESLCSPLSPKDTGSGPGDPGGSCVGCASGPEKFEYLPTAGGRMQSDSPCEFPLPIGGGSLSPVAQDHPQSPALYLEVSGKASTEHVIGAGGDDGPAVSHNQEELEVKAMSKGKTGQGLSAPTDTLASPPEPATSKAHSGPPMGHRRSKCAELGRAPVPCAQDQPEDTSPGGCPRLVS